MADCKVYREEIEELAGVGRLSLEARAHVNACEACSGFEQEGATLRRLVRELERVEAPADFEFRLRARMAASRGGRRKPFRPAYGFAALAAAALFLFVSTSLYIRQERQRKPEAVGHGALTAGSGGEDSKPRQPQNAVALATGASTDTDTATKASRKPNASQFGQLKVKTTRPALPPQTREVALRETAGRSNAKNYLTSAFTGAGVIGRGQPVKISLDTGAQPLRVVVRDERGAARVVPMRSVSFGSQELLAREGSGHRTTSTDREGVW